ncbi:Beta-lactamase superfamily domain protein [uncultured archaeon]|nr:Beta-lactamase superfamily domain protein [uncultured archaeon]
MQIDNVELKWLGHSGFLIKNSKIIYVDPYNIRDGLPKADIILVTHDHYDHCSIQDLGKIVQEGTRIVMPADCHSKVNKFDVKVKTEIVERGSELTLGDIKLSVLPAYNINKTFHPKEELGVGYLIKINDLLIYHAGDTDIIPEMKNLTGHNQPNKKFIALLPIGGRFTMSAEEAVEAAKIIKPFLAIPMHYGSVVGNESDAKDFVELCKEAGIDAKILERE